MGVPTSEVGYTSATTGRGDHEVHKGHVVALAQKKVGVCVALGTQHTMRMYLWPVRLYNTFPSYLINGTSFFLINVTEHVF
jgi:hypothetical protein